MSASTDRRILNPWIISPPSKGEDQQRKYARLPT